MKKAVIFVLILSFILILSSCQLKEVFDKVKDKKDKDEGLNVELNVDEEDKDENEDSDTDDEDNEDEDKDDNKKSQNSSGQYAIYCNDTVSVVKDDLETKFTLVMFATCEDGENGTYRGSIALDYGLDASQLTGIGGAPIEGFGGFNVSQRASDIEFEVIPFDLDAYATYGSDTPSGQATVVPLINGTSMALLTPNMSGTGQLGMKITGQTDSSGGSITAEVPETSSSASGPLLIKMYIDDGNVTIEIPTLKQAMDYQSFDAILSNNSDIIKQAQDISNKTFNSKE